MTLASYFWQIAELRFSLLVKVTRYLKFFPFFILTVKLQLLDTNILNVLKQLLVTTKSTSYIAETLLRYLEEKEELLLYLNKTVTNAIPSIKLKTMLRYFCYLKSNDVSCFLEEM
jgi:hypothetical protein